MAKATYIGIDGVARKVKKGYIGVGGVARKIKKAYIGVGGVARPCWAGGVPTMYGLTSQGLMWGRCEHAAATTGNYALFAGGYSLDGEYLKSVETYNTSLTRGTATDITTATASMAGGSINNYAIFLGGLKSGGKYVGAHYVYDTSLILTTNRSIASYPSAQGRSANVGDYVIFGGGSRSSGASNMAMAINSSIVYTNLGLNMQSQLGAAASNGTYAIFGWGNVAWEDMPDCGNIATAFNSSLTKTSITIKTENLRYYLSGAKAGNYALFAGGNSYSGNYSNIVEAYNTSLTLTSPSVLSEARTQMSSETLGDHAIFYCGSGRTAIDVYDSSLTRTNSMTGLHEHSGHTATTVGNYALFAGATTSTYGYKVAAITIV